MLTPRLGSLDFFGNHLIELDAKLEAELLELRLLEGATQSSEQRVSRDSDSRHILSCSLVEHPKVDAESHDIPQLGARDPL